MKKVTIFDTTLRDGEQAPGYSMNMNEKLEIAVTLEEMGVDYIEAGFATTSGDDFEAVSEVSARVKCGVASLSRMKEKDIYDSYLALKNAVKPRIHTFIATSEIHMRDKLKMSPDMVLKSVADYVRYAKSLCPDVEFSAEDATRSDIGFLIEIIETAIEAGANVINLPDTVGYSTPTETFRLFKEVGERIVIPDNVILSAHCHNDLGMAVANSAAAVAAGAEQVECTLCGIGERAGNTALEELAMLLKTRRDFYKAETPIDTRKIYSACRQLSAIVGMPTPPNKPIVGANAFSHEAGIHQHGVLANRATYEIMSPEEIGIPQNNFVLGKHSGRHGFEQRLSELGFNLSVAELDKAFEMFKVIADRKKTVTDKDLRAIIGENKRNLNDGFKLVRFIVNSGNTIPSMASVKLLRNGVELEDSCTGTGPIDAAFKAVDRIIKNGSYSGSISYTMEDYRINSVTEGEDALGEVLIKLRADGEVYNGRGLSTDIIEASIKAYLNGLNKALAVI